jgi:hypothetical protein
MSKDNIDDRTSITADIDGITIGDADDGGAPAAAMKQTPDMVFEPVFVIERVCEGPHVGDMRVGVGENEDLQSLADSFYSAMMLFHAQQREMMLRAMMSAVAEVLRHEPLEKASIRLENFNNYVLNRTGKAPKPLAQC